MSQLLHPSGDRYEPVGESPAVWNDGHPRFADRHDAGRRLAAVLDVFRWIAVAGRTVEAEERVAALAIDWLIEHLNEAAPIPERRGVVLA